MKRANVTILYPQTDDPRIHMARARECCKQIGIDIRVLRATRLTPDKKKVECIIDHPEGAALEEEVLSDYLSSSDL